MFKEGDKIKVVNVDGSLRSFPCLLGVEGEVIDCVDAGTVFIRVPYNHRKCVFIVCVYEIELI